jgi:hypothetical protein
MTRAEASAHIGHTYWTVRYDIAVERRIVAIGPILRMMDAPESNWLPMGEDGDLVSGHLYESRLEALVAAHGRINVEAKVTLAEVAAAQAQFDSQRESLDRLRDEIAAEYTASSIAAGVR